MRFSYALAIAASLFAFSHSPGHAQSCGDKYKVVSGDTLSGISASAYDNPQKWSLIYYSNQDAIGDDPSKIYPGQVFSIPCADQAAAEIAQEEPVVEPARAGWRRSLVRDELGRLHRGGGVGE